MIINYCASSLKRRKTWLHQGLKFGEAQGSSCYLPSATLVVTGPSDVLLSTDGDGDGDEGAEAGDRERQNLLPDNAAHPHLCGIEFSGKKYIECLCFPGRPKCSGPVME